MSIPTSVLGILRDQWADRFTDTCTITRVSGRTYNTASGKDTPTTATVYSGPGLYRPAGARATERGGRTVVVRTGNLYLPHTATGLKVGQEVTLTSATDPDLTGTKHRIVAVSRDTYATRRHCELEEVQDGP